MVLNALDNLEARRWVNKMCLSAKVPLVESGTAGFLGQVQPIMKVSFSSSSAREVREQGGTKEARWKEM